MKIAVVGLWHLGCVTAACLAKFGHHVIGFDENENIIRDLKNGLAPLYEPGLNELIVAGQQSQRLFFTTEKNALIDLDVFWITYDTPVDEEDRADVMIVKNAVIALFPVMKNNVTLIISSQLPAGSIRELKEQHSIYTQTKKIYFACLPENLRLGQAIQVFTQPDRVIAGIDNDAIKSIIESVLQPIKDKIIWMSIESAEVAKHAVNAFLAASVTFINEIATLCEKIGAKASDVEIALKSEIRIGPKAYLRAGAAFAGGTLARDVNYLISLGKQYDIVTPFFSGILNSNVSHKQWLRRKLSDTQKDLRKKNIAVFGLSYKPGTNTLRRSMSIETCVWLFEQGATIHAYDKTIQILPDPLTKFITLQTDIKKTLRNADIVIVLHEYPELRELIPKHFLPHAAIYDAGGYLKKNLQRHQNLNYYMVGEI